MSLIDTRILTLVEWLYAIPDDLEINSKYHIKIIIQHIEINKYQDQFVDLYLFLLQYELYTFIIKIHGNIDYLEIYEKE